MIDQQQTALDPLTIVKMLAVIVLGLGSFVLGLVPLKLVQMWDRDQEIAASIRPRATANLRANATATRTARQVHESVSPAVSKLLCFGGGVLLFTTLLHLQPEVRDHVVQLQHAGRLPEGPVIENLGDLIFCAGFFAVFAVDELVHWALDRFADSHERSGTGRRVRALHRSMSLRRRGRAVQAEGSDDPKAAGTAGKADEAHNDTEDSWSNAATVQDAAVIVIEPPARERRDGERSITLTTAENANSGPSFRHLFAVLALSFHEVIEGLSIGMMQNVDDTWYLFVAVAVHKLVIAFCIGQELAWSRVGKRVTVTYVATFAFITPFGISIGMALSYFDTNDDSPGPLSVVLQGVASGTLLYVVFFEVLARHRKPGQWHLLSIILGFGIMFTLQMASKYTLCRTLLHVRIA
ncbi:zinc transporter ZIP3-like [Sipha flava]|uniref:Zinc transporter ZIP3-like n=1 Tax=Sipha flava TaxID=143950 RepID=A0A8B8F4N1_9HEMI|nr:zinc transporter ZIP3-like [Sipha flava]